MNDKKKSLIDILSESDYPTFEESVKSKIIEKLAWAYYNEMEDDIKKRLTINNKSNTKP